jgi:tetratricopeptide (TPR) repeat protein
VDKAVDVLNASLKNSGARNRAPELARCDPSLDLQARSYMENRKRKMKNHFDVAARWMVVVIAALFLVSGAIAQEPDDMSAEDYYLRAKEALRKAAEEDPPGIDNWRAMQKERLKRALADLTKAIELEPDNREYLIERSNVFHSMDEPRLAIKDLTRVIELDPTDPELYSMRADIYDTEGMEERSLADRTKAISLDAKNPRWYNERGIAYSHQGKTAQAIVDYDRALKVDPKNTDALANRAYAYFSSHDFSRSLANWTMVIKLEPSFAYHRVSRAEVYMTTRQYAKAIADYTEAIRLSPDVPDPFERRAEAYRNIGKILLAKKDELTAKTIRSKM